MPRKKRFWDWAEVGLKCALPATVMYFITAWAMLIRREVEWASGSAVLQQAVIATASAIPTVTLSALASTST